MTVALEIEDLTARLGETDILSGLDLELPYGEIHAVMGPNGSGKSTLCHVLSGRPGYEVEGTARLDGVDLLGQDVDGRARLGLLQVFQYPVEVPGVHLRDFLLEAAEELGIPETDAESRIEGAVSRFGMEPFVDRSLNDDLSGGEKKRSEMFQLTVLDPKVALIDEVDSGLDIDAVRQVAQAVEEMRSPERAILLITHYSRILRYLVPDRVHVMIGGRIAESGGPELADELEEAGYEAVRARLGIAPSEVSAAPPAPDPFADLPFDEGS